MLDDAVKAEIQQSYSQWLQSHSFKPRYGQRLMIAGVAKAMAQANEDDAGASKFCVVEAGTGIGKTVAYSLAALPVAQAMNKTLVISTATVALQEQLVNKDLPDLRISAGIEFSFTLAKGRGRYLCLSKLDTALQGSQSSGQADLSIFYPDDTGKTGPPAIKLYQAMSEAVLNGSWSGDRDDWPETVEEADWRLLTSDRSQCHNRRCSYVSDCSFFKARDSLQEVDCIVTNHDLVLADLALGGGAILPEPEECVFIFDEAHHLSDKAVQHFSSSIRLNGSLRWIQQVQKVLEMVQQQWPKARLLENAINQVYGLGNDIVMFLQQLPELLQAQLDEHESDSKFGRAFKSNRQEHRFVAGEIPPGIRRLCTDCEKKYAQMEHYLTAISNEMQSSMEADIEDIPQLEQWFPVVGAAVNRVSSGLELFQQFAAAEPMTEATDQPMAYWLSCTELDNGYDYGLHCAPLLAAKYLQDLLWSRCSAAVLTSATLTALGSFERLIMRSGVDKEATFLRIPSPFDYQANALFSVPKLACNPSNTEQHTSAIVKFIEQLDEEGGVLVLFSSRRQMLNAFDALNVGVADRVLMQDQRSKQALLDAHVKIIDTGERSIIFGLASFAEGVDLRGSYCRHVVIAKIPFAVPDDPVEEALAEWIQKQGRNPFMEVAVPDAALRLVQACGRLIRSENDTGTVTLLDRRIIEKRYGQELLNSLPPFRLELS